MMKEYAKFLIDTGGMDVWEKMNKEKAEMIYKVIDESKGFYINEVDKSCRSRMNIPFRCLKDIGLEHLFLREAERRKLVGLRSSNFIQMIYPGIRASLYNGVPYLGVVRLRDFMVWFKKHFR